MPPGQNSPGGSLKEPTARINTNRLLTNHHHHHHHHHHHPHHHQQQQQQLHPGHIQSASNNAMHQSPASSFLGVGHSADDGLTSSNHHSNSIEATSGTEYDSSLPTVVCSQPGCGKEFRNRSSLIKHLAHPRIIPLGLSPLLSQSGYRSLTANINSPSYSSINDAPLHGDTEMLHFSSDKWASP
ncbi:unnamed protein product [Protopolystoma xenopodis]|uniref:C2H2-type domain-containing protein n=1 Tax=Protopolystoma xenopodis TaxID=117903 RepID=A0A448WIW3_9PLAT|nr:unnamed protein product [Protopolystoma xenopodis]